MPVPPPCRAQVAELLSASNTARCEADTLRQQLKGKDLELEHMTIALAGALWAVGGRQGHPIAATGLLRAVCAAGRTLPRISTKDIGCP